MGLWSNFDPSRQETGAVLLGRDTAKQQPAIEWQLEGLVVKTGDDEVLFTGCFERDTDERRIGRAGLHADSDQRWPIHGWLAAMGAGQMGAGQKLTVHAGCRSIADGSKRGSGLRDTACVRDTACGHRCRIPSGYGKRGLRDTASVKPAQC